MEIQSTTQTTYVQSTQTAKKNEVSEVQFSIEPNQTLDPYSVSFQEYQKLTFDDLEVIYQNEPHPRKNLGTAQGLLTTSTFTNDDILNNVLFDDAIHSHNTNQPISSTFHTMAMSAIPDMIKNIELIFDPDNLAVTPEQIINDPFLQELMLKKDGIRSKIPEPTIDIKDGKELLEYFKNYKNFFNENLRDGWTGAIDKNKIFKDIENIVVTYEKEVNENKVILNELTKNTKPNPLDNVSQTSEEKDNVPRNSKGQNFLDIVDEVDLDAFKKLNISKEDEILFRTILEDSEVTASEAKSLTYDQASKLGKFVFDSLSTVMKDRPENEIPIVSIGNPTTTSVLHSANLTNNETFNRAIHKMVLENTTTNKHDLSSFFSAITSNIMQMHYNEEFRANFMPNTFSGGIEHPYFLEKDNIDIDYEELLNNAISIYGDKSKIQNAAQEQYQKLTDLYSALNEYYNQEIIKEKK